MTRVALLSAVLLLGACSATPVDHAGPGAPDEGTLLFAALGDMPYNDREHALLTAPGGEIVSRLRVAAPRFVVHVGDLKASAVPCTDSLLTARRAQIHALYPGRVVYTPGDNDWTDCDRASLAVRFDELERLRFLRTLFFTGEGLDLARDVPGLVRQQGHAENAMWQTQGLVFGTLHVPGTNDAREEILRSDVGAALDEADRRGAMNEAWLDRLFGEAASARALILALHSDIYAVNAALSPDACTADVRQGCDGHRRLRDRIEQRAAAIGKPVLLIHGSTSAYCLDRPAEAAPNLWRLNTPGDYVISDAALVTVRPEAAAPFEASLVLAGEAMPGVCG